MYKVMKLKKKIDQRAKRGVDKGQLSVWDIKKHLGLTRRKMRRYMDGDRDKKGSVL